MSGSNNLSKENFWRAGFPLTAVLPRDFNIQATWDLESGAPLINFRLDRATRHGQDAEALDADDVRRGGLSLSTLADAHQAFTSMFPEERPVFVTTGSEAAPLIGLFAALLAANGQPAASLNGTVGADPLGVLASEGTLPMDLPLLFDEMAATVRWASQNMPNLSPIVVDMTPYHAAGIAASREVALAAATAAAYIAAMEERDIDSSLVLAKISVAFSGSVDERLDEAKMLTTERLIEKITSKTGANYYILPRQKAMYSQSLALGTTQERLGDELALSGMAEFDENSTADEIASGLFKQSSIIYDEIIARGGIFKTLVDGVVLRDVAADLKARLLRYAARLDENNVRLARRRPSALGVDTERILWQRDRDISEYRADIDEAACAKKIFDLQQTAINEPSFLDAIVGAFLSGAMLGDVVIAIHRDNNDFYSGAVLPQHKAASQFLKLRRAVAAFQKEYNEKPLIYLGYLEQEASDDEFKKVLAFLESIAAPGSFAVQSEHFNDAEKAAVGALRSGAQVIAFAASPDFEYSIEKAASIIKDKGADMPIAGIGYPERTENVDIALKPTSTCLDLLVWAEQ